MENVIELVIKTVAGKRMVFTEDGKMIGKLLMTRETQELEMSQVGKCEVLMKVICKCE